MRRWELYHGLDGYELVVYEVRAWRVALVRLAERLPFTHRVPIWRILDAAVAGEHMHRLWQHMLVPYAAVRNVEGTIIGCRMLARPV